MAKSSAVTILDVAARAGVHPSTVSRTLSRSEMVAPETRERVQQVIDELGFVPNRAARGLITGRTGNVAVVVPDITNPHFASILRAADGAAREHDHQLLLVDTGERPEHEVAAVRSLASQVDGFIVASPRRLHRELAVLGETPVVFLNRPVAGRPSVVFRTAPALATALDHLSELGHRRVAYLGGPRGSWAASERLKALRTSVARHHLELFELGPNEPTFAAGAARVDDIVAQSITAVLAFNDQMALGVIARLAEWRIRVPQQISVVGCDDIPVAAMVAPSLTTLHLPAEEAGRAAVEQLLEGESARGATEIALPARLVVRASTGRAR